uniref:ATPase AAA-type core domain-containing protein n=1 Tax=Geospiza parvula TaxID=87175 RepID=A0A8U8BCG0_GEOPR
CSLLLSCQADRKFSSSQPALADPEQVMKMLATAYVQYLAILRKLDEAHAPLIHQQKRAAVRHALDGVMGRILEIKGEMVALEKSECHSMAAILMELQRVPVGLPPRGAGSWERWVLFGGLLFVILDLFAASLGSPGNFQEGIRVIQVAERARQGRARAAFMRRIYLEEKRQSKKQEQTMAKSPDDAATCIQKVSFLCSSNSVMSLACRTIDSLYQQLAEERLLIQVKNVNLSDYMGKVPLLDLLRETGAQPLPSIPEVRQLVALYGILPLGSQTVHENAPLVKSLLLAGPAGVGKKMLVHAICTEAGANLFSLTPSNTGKYPGKDGLIMVLHMILKVGKELQPSVVWIGDTERIYSKGVNFKRLARLLPQFLRALKPKDRVLLVGTTRRPFDANPGPFCKVYQKIILVPKPDYLTRFALWKHYILQCGGVLTKLLNLNCLAQVSDGFTQGHVVDVVHTVLTELRLLQMARKPLRTAEFVTSLARHDPVYNEEEEAFQVNSLFPVFLEEETAAAPLGNPVEKPC